MYAPVFKRIRGLMDILLCNRWMNVARCFEDFAKYVSEPVNNVFQQDKRLLESCFVDFLRVLIIHEGRLLVYPNFAALRDADTLCQPFGPGDTTHMGLNADALAAHERAKSRVMWQAMVTHDGKPKQPMLSIVHHVANENLRGIHAHFVAWRLLKWPL
jgi:hypothetical protein